MLVALAVGFGGGSLSHRLQDPAKKPSFNPAEQRVQMIKHLASLDARTANIEKSLLKLEQAASMHLQLMMKQQEPVENNPHTIKPPTGGKTQGPR